MQKASESGSGLAYFAFLFVILAMPVPSFAAEWSVLPSMSAKGTKSFLIVVAEEERISVSRLKQLVKEEPLTTGNWFDPKPKPRGAISKKQKSQY